MLQYRSGNIYRHRKRRIRFLQLFMVYERIIHRIDHPNIYTGEPHFNIRNLLCNYQCFLFYCEHIYHYHNGYTIAYRNNQLFWHSLLYFCNFCSTGYTEWHSSLYRWNFQFNYRIINRCRIRCNHSINEHSRIIYGNLYGPGQWWMQYRYHYYSRCDQSGRIMDR